MNQSPNLINWLLTNQMGGAQNMGMGDAYDAANANGITKSTNSTANKPIAISAIRS